MKKKLPFIIGGIVLFLVLVGVTLFVLFQYTEVFGKKVVPLNIQSITIQYAPGYDLNTVSTMNQKETVVEVQKIELKGKDLDSFKKELSKVTKSESSSKKEIVPQYEVLINKKVTLQGEDAKGFVVECKKKTRVKLPSSFQNKIQDLMNANNKKILKTIATQNVTFKVDGSIITVKNKDNLKYIQDALVYYPVQIKEDFKAYQGGYKVEVILDNNVKVYLYDNSIGYVLQKEGETDTSTYGVFTEGLEELLKQIHQISVE